MREAIEVVEHRVTEEMSEVLSQPFTEEEVAKAPFQMHPTKAPVTDGMSAIMENFVSRVALNALNNETNLGSVSFLYFYL